MMNRRISIVPLILGGIIILMSLFVPHHHHSQRICFELSHYNTIEETAADCCPASSGTQEDEEENCLIDMLNKMEVLRQQDLNLDFGGGKVQGVSNLLFLLFFCSYLSLLTAAVYKPVTSDLKFLHDYWGISGLNRRGPPSLIA